MSRIIPSRIHALLRGLYPSLVGLVFVLTISLGASGCANLNLRGEAFPRDETYDWSRHVRPADENVELFGFSNKARQIERNCGAR